jgi:hypothetical protein
LMLVIGFRGNRLYLKHCIEKISMVRKGTSLPGGISARLQEEGGVNMALAASLGICCLIAFFYLFPL